MAAAAEVAAVAEQPSGQHVKTRQSPAPPLKEKLLKQREARAGGRAAFPRTDQRGWSPLKECASQVCYPGTCEVEAGGSRVQSHPQLHSKFKAALGYVSPSFKNINENNERF